jgi:hypothetical protein
MIPSEQLSERDLKDIRNKLIVTIVLMVFCYLLTGVHK